jgi:hypothetical protein
MVIAVITLRDPVAVVLGIVAFGIAGTYLLRRAERIVDRTMGRASRPGPLKAVRGWLVIGRTWQLTNTRFIGVAFLVMSVALLILLVLGERSR